MTELVSVVIPTKNRSKELQRAINSVLKQTHQEFEILVVDDKSEENIKSVVQEYHDPRLIYFYNSSSISNANVCRNIGVQAAKGAFIAMLDSDDEWLPNHLESKLRFLRENDCDGSFGSAYVDNGDNRFLRLSRPKQLDESMVDYLLSSGKAQTSSYFLKTKYAKNLIWDEALLRNQDLDFSARFAEKYSFIPCEEPTSIIHWKKGEKRSEDIPSQIRFYKKHRNRISPSIKVKYLSETYSRVAQRNDIPKEHRKFFSSECLKQIRFMSFADFSLLSSRKSNLGRLIDRIEYVIRVLFI